MTQQSRTMFFAQYLLISHNSKSFYGVNCINYKSYLYSIKVYNACIHYLCFVSKSKLGKNILSII